MNFDSNPMLSLPKKKKKKAQISTVVKTISKSENKRLDFQSTDRQRIIDYLCSNAHFLTKWERGRQCFLQNTKMIWKQPKWYHQTLLFVVVRIVFRTEMIVIFLGDLKILYMGVSVHTIVNGLYLGISRKLSFGKWLDIYQDFMIQYVSLRINGHK